MHLTSKQLCQVFNNDNQQVTAVDHVDLHVRSGEMVALTGRSGSGKSTLLYQLAVLLKPTSGTIHYGETNPYALPHRQRNQFRAKHIGILYPDFRLLPYLSVAENIATPSLAIHRSPREIAERTEELIEQFDLSERAHHRPSSLSSGEQQRTALARALFANPSFIIADEPTGNLDETNSQMIIQTLKDYCHLGNAVVIATHDPLVIAASHRTLVMNNGCLSEK